jgi:hypothetical protein
VTVGAGVQVEGVRHFGGSRRDALFDARSGRYFVPNVIAGDAARFLVPPDESAPLVAILDSGVLAEHPLLKPRIAATADFTGTGEDDFDGHGTEVAITLVLESSNVRLLIAKVIAHDLLPVAVQATRIADGIRWAAEQGARAINISLGFPTRCTEAHRDLCAAVREALDHGVFVLVAGEARCPGECDPRILVIGEELPDGDIRSRIPPTFVHGTFGRVEMVPWEQWLANDSTKGR